MVFKFIARFKLALMGAFVLAASGLASAQSQVSFNWPMYNSAGSVIGNVQGPVNTTTGTCNNGEQTYTIVTYTFQAWVLYGAQAGGGSFNSYQATYVSNLTGTENGYCPALGWSGRLPYTMPFTNGSTSNWQGHGVVFNGQQQATYY